MPSTWPRTRDCDDAMSALAFRRLSLSPSGAAATFRRAVVAVAITLASPWLTGELSATAVPADAPELSRYREFALGTSLASIVAATRSKAADVTELHSRPSLVQELRWRPRYATGHSFEPEAVRDMTFRFLDDRLYSIEVTYDAFAMRGLTSQDVVDALSAVYGPPMTASPGSDIPLAKALAGWQNDGAAVSLFEDTYPSPFRLLVVSPALELRARAAIAEGTRLDALDAPRREAALRAAEVEKRRSDDAEARDINKAGFRP